MDVTLVAFAVHLACSTDMVFAVIAVSIMQFKIFHFDVIFLIIGNVSFIPLQKSHKSLSMQLHNQSQKFFTASLDHFGQ